MPADLLLVVRSPFQKKKKRQDPECRALVPTRHFRYMWSKISDGSGSAVPNEALPSLNPAGAALGAGRAPQGVHPAKRGEHGMGHCRCPVLIASTTERSIRSSLNNSVAC